MVSAAQHEPVQQDVADRTAEPWPEERQGSARERHGALELLAAGQTGDNLQRHGAKDRGGDVLAAHVAGDEVLHIGLGKDTAARGEGVHVPGGGTHHGLPDRANGFCYLNDVVLAIRVMLAAGLSRVAYVDLDAHHCDGVELAFAGDPRVRMISVHEENRWPFSGGLTDRAGGSGFFLPVPRGYNDTEARAVLHRLILPRVAGFAPQAVVVQCGADSLTEDPLSRLCLSNRAYLEALAALRPLSPRLLVLGGGGYNPWSVARAWTGIWAILNDIAVPDALPPQAEAVLRALTWSRSDGRNPPDRWFTTLADEPRPGPVRAEVRAAITAALQ